MAPCREYATERGRDKATSGDGSYPAGRMPEMLGIGSGAPDEDQPEHPSRDETG